MVPRMMNHYEPTAGGARHALHALQQSRQGTLVPLHAADSEDQDVATLDFFHDAVPPAASASHQCHIERRIRVSIPKRIFEHETGRGKKGGHGDADRDCDFTLAFRDDEVRHARTCT